MPSSREAVAGIYFSPLLELVHQAALVHRRFHDPSTLQCAALLSVKTGACPEDCAYCPQSAHHNARLEREALMPLEEVVTAAKNAKAHGADRFCMGAAWREIRDNDDFERVLAMVRAVKEIGLQTCVTLGMLEAHQAERLKAAGLDYYNHNLDTSREFYHEIIGTRTYADRLETLSHVRDAGLRVCCGGIIGMGESDEDRIGLLWELARQQPQPESVPINALVAVAGTPLQNTPPVAWDVIVRTVATARIAMPRSWVRLSAGRTEMSQSTQAFCFLAGANSIFLGDRLLTTANPSPNTDGQLLDVLGLRAQAQA
ncbi:MAG: biotin synthase BioB [Myxococcota bacterium]